MDEIKNKRFGILLSNLSIVFICLYVIVGILFGFSGLINTFIIMWIERVIILGALFCSIIGIITLKNITEKDNEIAVAKIFALISLIISLGIIVFATIYIMIF